MTTVEQRNYARKIECEEEGLYFSRYFFKQRTGGKMIVAPHHRVIQQTLDRVIDGEIKRLIIRVAELLIVSKGADMNVSVTNFNRLIT